MTVCFYHTLIFQVNIYVERAILLNIGDGTHLAVVIISVLAILQKIRHSKDLQAFITCNPTAETKSLTYCLIVFTVLKGLLE